MAFLVSGIQVTYHEALQLHSPLSQDPCTNPVLPLALCGPEVSALPCGLVYRLNSKH
jgi:hypothetical protein